MGIGIPGSGKTTKLKDFAEKNNYYYISTDDIRQELLGDAKNQNQMKLIWDTAYLRVKEGISLGKSVVFDATFTNPKIRSQAIDLFRSFGANKVQGIFLDVDVAVAQERNKNRERVVPAYAIDRMYNEILSSEPGVVDGFDSVFFLNDTGKLVEVEMMIGNKEINKNFEGRKYA